MVKISIVFFHISHLCVTGVGVEFHYHINDDVCHGHLHYQIKLCVHVLNICESCMDCELK